MPFPFTFIFSVPGLINPFAAANTIASSKPRRLVQQQQQPERYSPTRKLPSNLPNTNRPRPPSPVNPTTSTSGPGPISRKRGWQPTFAEPSRSTTTLASTAGYIDARAPTRFAGDSPMGSSWSSSQYSFTTPVDQDDLHVDSEEGEPVIDNITSQFFHLPALATISFFPAFADKIEGHAFPVTNALDPQPRVRHAANDVLSEAMLCTCWTPDQHAQCCI